MSKGHTYLLDELVRALGDDGAAILACRLHAFAEAQDGDTADVSIAYICRLFKWSDNKTRRIADKLESCGFWYREQYVGNKGTTIWRRGEAWDNFKPDKIEVSNTDEMEGLKPYKIEGLTLRNEGVNNKNNIIKKRDNKLSPKKDEEPLLFEEPIKEEPVKVKKVFRKPTLDEVRAYCAERANGLNAQAFLDHYESVGWMVGKNHMKDWKAAVRTWEHNEKNIRNNGNGKRHTSPADAARAAELGIALADAELADER